MKHQIWNIIWKFMNQCTICNTFSGKLGQWKPLSLPYFPLLSFFSLFLFQNYLCVLSLLNTISLCVFLLYLPEYIYILQMLFKEHTHGPCCNNQNRNSTVLEVVGRTIKCYKELWTSNQCRMLWNFPFISLWFYLLCL